MLLGSNALYACILKPFTNLHRENKAPYVLYLRMKALIAHYQMNSRRAGHMFGFRWSSFLFFFVFVSDVVLSGGSVAELIFTTSIFFLISAPFPINVNLIFLVSKCL